MKSAYIFDIDGTIADCSHRLHHIQPPFGLVHFEPGETEWKPDWDTFYSLCVNDKPIDNVCHLLRVLQRDFEIIFITGRSEKFRNHTTEWLKRQLGSFAEYHLFMRADGDHRPDYVIKKEIYDEHIKDKFNVLGVFEDRDQVVKMWRELGLTCYQVADGSY